MSHILTDLEYIHSFLLWKSCLYISQLLVDVNLYLRNGIQFNKQHYGIRIDKYGRHIDKYGIHKDNYGIRIGRFQQKFSFG